jgi:glycerophosphoryl diester phosphodiesterase
MRSEGLGVVCWHEERPDELRALLKLGVSAVCTDRLDLIRDVANELADRGGAPVP